MPTDVISPALASLAEEVAGLLDNPPAPRTIKQWQRLGIVPAPVVTRLGNRGTESAYPPGTAEAVVEVAELVALHGLDRVVLGLFGVGRDPTESAVRTTYRRVLDELERTVLRRRGTVNSQTTRHFASGLARMSPEAAAHWKTRAQRQVTEENGIQPLHGKALPAITLAEVRRDDLEDTLSSLVDPGAGSEPPPILGLTIEDEVLDIIDALGGTPTLTEKRKALDTASWDELRAARNVASQLMGQMFKDPPDDDAVPLRAFLLSTLQSDDVIRVGEVFAQMTVTILVLWSRSESEPAR